MCIERKEQWVYGGKSYDDELEAVKAALTDLGTRFVKEYHSKPLDGMLAIGADVTSLRARYIDLTDPVPQVEKAPSEKVAGEPKAHPLGYAGGDPEDPLSTNSMMMRYMLIPRHTAAYKAVRLWLEREGYKTFEVAMQNLRGPKRQELSRLIDMYVGPEQ